MKSMTGYGFAEGKCAGMSIRAEVSSVNKKGLDVVVNVPRILMGMEVDLKKLVEGCVSRGRVVLGVNLSRDVGKVGGGKLALNREALKGHVRTLKGVAKEVGCSGEFSMEFLLSLPGVMQGMEDEVTDAVRKGVLGVVKKALGELVASREREGKVLAQGLVKMLRRLDPMVVKIEKENPKVVGRYRENLLKRLEDVDVKVDEDRVAKEVAFFADRCDITEELARLRAHLKEGVRLLQGGGAVGRNLDFLLQEINREVNTTGSKSNGLEISKQVIALKAELEKIREQVQNLE